MRTILPISFRDSARLYHTTTVLLIIVASIRISSTLTVFSSTPDEPMHISAALQLLETHQYSYQPVNPPLPRLVFGLAPWLGGLEFDPARPIAAQLLRVFYSGGFERYTHNLFLARIGNLFFFILAAVVLALLINRALGPGPAALGTLLFTTQPVVLGYAGLATHDAAAVAGVGLSLLAFERWIHRPSYRAASLFGAAYAFAVVCKFSCIAFVPAACGAVYALRIAMDADTRRAWPLMLRQLPISAAACVVTIWAAYGFTVGSVGDLRPALSPFRDSVVARVGASINPSVPLPAPRFFEGVIDVLVFDREGFLSYLFGRIRWHGWWSYFPIAVALKTTLPTLILAALFWLARRERIVIESAAASAAILGVAMTSELDLGVRYVLPLYIPLTIAATGAAVVMIRSASRLLRASAIVLLLCHVASSVAVHPDYFPYFNLLAGNDPSRYLVDSNLDWGQDVLRLRPVLKEEPIDSIAVGLMGWHDFDALGFPPWKEARSYVSTPGWYAVGDHFYRVGRASGGLWWLEGLPYRRIGTSIRLFHVRSEDRGRLMLPIWFRGTFRGWTTELNVQNTSDVPVSLFAGAGIIIPARSTVTPPLDLPDERLGPILHCSLVDAGRLSLTLTLRSGDVVLQVPVVRESDFRSEPIELAGLPTSPTARATLRIYDINGNVSAATIRLVRDGITVATRTIPLRQPEYENFASSLELPLEAVLRGPYSPTDRLVIDHPMARYWAFLSVTDAGKAYVVVPGGERASRPQTPGVPPGV